MHDRNTALATLHATIIENPYIPYRPHVKQAEALMRPEREVFYGGAAGGGKSDWLLMSALQYVTVPGYAALILRKSYSDLALPGAIMDRAHDWLDNTDAHWSETDKTWTFRSGATLTFGYLQTEKDKYRYRSAEFQFVGFDELTDFTSTMYEYLFSRTRRLAGSWVPIRMRSASNPDGPGADWVRERFVDGQPIKGQPYAQHYTDNTGSPIDRCFIPAVMRDNPALDADAYAAALAQLDPVTRKQLEDGDWEVRRAGGMFDPRNWPIVDSAPTGIPTVRFWDLAATEPSTGNPDPDWTRGLLMGDDDGHLYIMDLASTRANPGGVETLVLNTAAADGYTTRIGMEQEPGSSGKNTISNYGRRVLKGYPFAGYRVTGSKTERAVPFAAAGAAGNVSIVRGPWNRDLIRELEAFPQDGFHDDIVDTCSGAHYVLTRRKAWVAV